MAKDGRPAVPYSLAAVIMSMHTLTTHGLVAEDAQDRNRTGLAVASRSLAKELALPAEGIRPAWGAQGEPGTAARAHPFGLACAASPSLATGRRRSLNPPLPWSPHLWTPRDASERRAPPAQKPSVERSDGLWCPRFAPARCGRAQMSPTAVWPRAVEGAHEKARHMIRHEGTLVQASSLTHLLTTKQSPGGATRLARPALNAQHTMGWP